MMTTNNKQILIIIGSIAACFALCMSPLQGDERRYEVRPEVTVPEYKTDVVRVIEAYERLMGSYIHTTDDRLVGLEANGDRISEQLREMDKKMALISAQLKTIQDKLGIETAVKSVHSEAATKTSKTAP